MSRATDASFLLNLAFCNIDETIPLSLLQPQDGILKLIFCLTTNASLRPVRKPNYNHAFLAKAFSDPSTYDVYFMLCQNDLNVDLNGPEAYTECAQPTEPEKFDSDKSDTCTALTGAAVSGK